MVQAIFMFMVVVVGISLPTTRALDDQVRHPPKPWEIRPGDMSHLWRGNRKIPQYDMGFSQKDFLVTRVNVARKCRSQKGYCIPRGARCRGTIETIVSAFYGKRYHNAAFGYRKSDICTCCLEDQPMQGYPSVDPCKAITCGEHARCELVETRRDFYGQCFCDEGYPNGNPYNKCSKHWSDLCADLTCGEHAECRAWGVTPGRKPTLECVCRKGYHGDPNEKCYPMDPILADSLTEPLEEILADSTEVIYTNITESTPSLQTTSPSQITSPLESASSDESTSPGESALPVQRNYYYYYTG